MRQPLLIATLLLATACTRSPEAPEPEPLPGTPVPHTVLEQGALLISDGGRGCDVVATEVFPTVSEATAYLDEHLLSVSTGLAEIPTSEQLVVAFSESCSTVGPELSVTDVRDVDGIARAYLEVFHPRFGGTAPSRPYVLFTIPATYPSLESVVTPVWAEADTAQ